MRVSSKSVARGLGRPVVHDDAVGHVDEGQAERGLRRPCGRRQRRASWRPAWAARWRRRRRAGTCAATGVFRVIDTFSTGPVSFGGVRPALWNGTLLTIPSTRLEKRYRWRQAGPRSGCTTAGRSAPGRGPGRRSASSRSALGEGTRGRDSGSPSGRLAREGPAIGQTCPTHRWGTCHPVVRHWPMASKFSSAKPSGSMRGVARGAGRVGAVLLQLLAQRTGLPDACSSRPGTSGGGGGGGAFSRFSSIHLPRSTGEVRLAYDDTVSTLACVRRLRGWCRSDRPCGTRRP